MRNPNRPAPGSCITSEPIRDRQVIAKIRAALADNPRNACLFELGIQTNLRIGDLLALTVGRVRGLRPGDTLPVRQQKRGKFGLRTLNGTGHKAISRWLEHHPAPSPDSALFPGKDGHTAITVPYASRLIKSWCKSAGLRGNYSAHSLRKTFGFHAVNTFNAPVHVVSAAFGHRDIATTLLYLGIQEHDVRELFLAEL